MEVAEDLRCRFVRRLVGDQRLLHVERIQVCGTSDERPERNPSGGAKVVCRVLQLNISVYEQEEMGIGNEGEGEVSEQSYTSLKRDVQPAGRLGPP